MISIVLDRRQAVMALAAAPLISASLLTGCASGGGASSGSASSQQPASKKLKVVTSFYPMADFASKVGGDRVEVANLVPAGTEPHDWEPAPKDMAAIQDADVFVYNGASMEGWVPDALKAVDTARVRVVEASKGIELLSGDGDEGLQYNPHVWLDPENAKRELENIRDALAAVDSVSCSTYEQNYERYASAFDELDQAYREQISAAKGKTIVVSHDAYGYLAKAYGLTVKSIAGMDADGEPDAKTMAQIIDFVKASNVKVIFSEDLVSPKVARQIADSTGAACRVLNPIEGLTDEQLKAGDDYVSVMKTNLKEIVAALNEE